MKRLAYILLVLMLAAVLCACGKTGETAEVPSSTLEPAAAQEPAAEMTPEPAEEDPEPTIAPLPLEEIEPAPEEAETPAPEQVETAPAAEGWQETYLTFLDDNYDIFAALWPEGLSGVGFIDLDLDGTPEMVIFDLGASATLGVQLFDQIDGQVVCVSSVQEAAAGAFGDEYFSQVTICASFFESFRLSDTAEGRCFWVDSANGTMETSWDEIIRFESRDGVLTPVSVCRSELTFDVEADEITEERYTVGDEETDAAGYEAAAAVYTGAADLGYEAQGVFLWNDMARYDTNYDGFMAMAQDAAAAYAPIAVG